LRLKQALGVKKKANPKKLANTEACRALEASVVGSVFRGADRYLKDYTIGRKIGEGAFSEVIHQRLKASYTSILRPHTLVS
jgi:hypothetical protein